MPSPAFCQISITRLRNNAGAYICETTDVCARTRLPLIHTRHNPLTRLPLIHTRHNPLTCVNLCVQAPRLYTILRQSKHGLKGMAKTFAGIPVWCGIMCSATSPTQTHSSVCAQMFERHPPYGPIYRFVIR